MPNDDNLVFHGIVKFKGQDTAELEFKIEGIEDGKMSYMNDAIAAVKVGGLSDPSAAAGAVAKVVEDAEKIAASTIADRFNDICGQLELIERIGDRISEVFPQAILYF